MKWILVLIVLMLSCQQKERYVFPTSTNLIHIDTEIDNSIRASDLFRKVEYFPLRMPENVELGAIDKLILTKDYIIIGDFYQTQKVFFFKRNGEFSHQISQLGEGPGRYLQLSDFSVIETEKKISILSPTKLLVFDIGGQFINEIKLPFVGVYKHESLKGGVNYYYVPANSNKELGDEKFMDYTLFLEKEGVIIPLVTTAELYRYLPFFSERDNLRRADDEVMFSFNFSDTIYILNKSEIVTKLVLDFGGRKMPLELFQKQPHDEVLNSLEFQERYAVHFPNLHFDYPWLSTKYRKGNWVTLLFNRELNKSYVFYTMVNDLDQRLNYLNIKFLNGHKIYSVHTAEELMSFPNYKELGLVGIDRETRIIASYEFLNP